MLWISIEKDYSSSSELRSLSLPYIAARIHAERREAESVAANIVLLAFLLCSFGYPK